MSTADELARRFRNPERGRARAAWAASWTPDQMEARRVARELGEETVQTLRSWGFLPLREVPWGPRDLLRRRGFLPPDGAEVWPIRSRYADELATATGQPGGGQWLGLHEDGLFGRLQLRRENTYPWSHLGEDSPERADGEARLAEFCAANRVRGAYTQFHTWPTPVPTRAEGGVVQAQRSATEWVPLREWVASAVTDTLEQGRDWQGGPAGRG